MIKPEPQDETSAYEILKSMKPLQFALFECDAVAAGFYLLADDQVYYWADGKQPDNVVAHMAFIIGTPLIYVRHEGQERRFKKDDFKLLRFVED